jgi:hypothetical protein
MTTQDGAAVRVARAWAHAWVQQHQTELAWHSAIASVPHTITDPFSLSNQTQDKRIKTCTRQSPDHIYAVRPPVHLTRQISSSAIN